MQTINKLHNWILFGLLFPAILWEQSHAKNFELAFFTRLPPSRIYQFPETSLLNLEARVSPANTTVFAAVLNLSRDGRGKDEGQLIPVHRMMAVLSGNQQAIPDRDQVLATINLPDWRAFVNKSLHWVAKNDLGVVVSRPFFIMKRELKPFPREQSQTHRFLKGNVGYVSCKLPSSHPSPPEMIFLKDGKQIQMTTSDDFEIRYRSVYIPPQMGDSNPTGQMVLLIRELEQHDAGNYTCMARLAKKTVRSSKSTLVMVERPQVTIPQSFLFSGISPNEKVRVDEGANITLICVFRGAPVAQVVWFYSIKNNRITIDNRFPTLTITSITRAEEGKYSCLAEDKKSSHVFQVFVKRRMKLKVIPNDIQVKRWSGSAKLDCEIEPGDSQVSTPPNWIVNGRFIKYNPTKYSITNNNLMSHLLINNLNENDLGVYQCYGIDLNGDWISKVVTITHDTDTVIRKAIADILERSEVTQKHTGQGLTGHLFCNVDQALRGRNYKPEDMEVRWYQGAGPGSPILDLTREGSVKYVVNFNQVHHDTLSILNPTAAHDAGMYSCRIYNKNQNLLMGAARIKLIITSDNNRETETKTTKPDSENEGNPKPDNESIPPVLADIPRPSVTRPVPYLPAAHLTWDLPPGVAETEVIHFRVEYRFYLGSTAAENGGVDSEAERRVFWRREADTSSSSITVANKKVTWSDVRMLDQVLKKREVTLYQPKVFKPGYIYSFRVVGVPRVVRNIHLLSKWTQSVSFGHIRSVKPMISRALPQANGQLKVSWSYTNQMFPVDRFQIICRPLGTADSEHVLFAQTPKDDVTRTYEVGSRSWEKEIPPVWSVNITGLRENRKYAVFLYGIQTLPSEQFTQISDVMLADIPKRVTKDSQINHSFGNNTDEIERKQLLFLILGSLAGILFVVALVLITMYAWHRLREKYPSRASTPPSFKSASQPLTPAHRPNGDPTGPGGGQYLGQQKHLFYHPGQSWTSGHHPLLATGGAYPPPLDGTVVARSDGGSGGGYLEALTLGGDIRHNLAHQMMRQQQPDQASSIYSQVGSDHRGSTSALSGMGKETIYARPPSDEMCSDASDLFYARSPNLTSQGCPSYNPPGPLRPGYMPQYQDFFSMRGAHQPVISGGGELAGYDESTLSRGQHAPVLPLNMTLSGHPHAYPPFAGSPYLYHGHGSVAGSGWVQTTPLDERVCPLPPPNTSSPRFTHIPRGKEYSAMNSSTPNNNVYSSPQTNTSTLDSRLLSIAT